MKQLICALLAAALAFGLTACSANRPVKVSSSAADAPSSAASEPAPPPEPSSEAEPAPSSSEPAQEEIELPPLEGAFSFSADDFIAQIDQTMSQNGLPTLAGSPLETGEREVKGFGTVDVRTYTLAKGVEVLFYETQDEGRLTQIMCNAVSTELDDAGIAACSVFASSMLAQLDPDAHQAVEQQLDLSQADDGQMLTASGDNATYIHLYANNTEMLAARPKT